MKVSTANRKQLAGTGNQKPEPKKQLPKTNPNIKLAEQARNAAQSSQQAANSAAVAAESIASGMALMEKHQLSVQEVMQQMINESRAVRGRDPVRLKVVKDKNGDIDYIDVLPLTIKK